MASRHRRPARHAAPASSPPRSTLHHRSLHCEKLEDRRLLAVVTVDTELDFVDFNDGKTSLREAIFATNTVPGADEIRFDFGHDGPGTILLTQGELAIADAVSIIGAGVGLLTIDGQLSSRLFSIGVAAGDATFRGMTLTRGQTTGDNISLADVMNQTHSGGAIRSVSSGLLTLDQVDVVSNGTTGVYASGGALFVTGPLAITLSKVRGNIASGANAEGGGVAVIGAASITATTFSGNRAARGGGVSASGVLTIDSSTLNGNRAVGGPIALGGAVYAMGTLSVVNSTISTNSAQAVASAQGAGIWTSGAATIAHSTIVANTASTSALGGIGSGGGLYGDQSAGETLTISHTIFGGNFATEENGELRLGIGTLELRYSLITDNDGTTLAEAPIGVADSKGNLIGGSRYGYIDPMLDGLEDNGGPTRTHAIMAGSPAAAAGDPTFALGQDGIPNYDQRGATYARMVGTRIDIGAVVQATTPIVVDSLDDADDGNYSPGQLTLREAFALADARPGFDAVEFRANMFATGPQTILLTQGELKLAESIEVRGPGASLLTIDARGNDVDPTKDWGGTAVLTVTERDTRIAEPIRLIGLSVTGGESSGIVSTEPLVLIDVDVHDNKSLGFAAYNERSAGGVIAPDLTLVSSRVANNRSKYRAGGIESTGTIFILRTEISNNVALGPFSQQAGGGLFVRTTRSHLSTVTILESLVVGNSSGGTGGVRIGSDQWGGSLVIAESLINDNHGKFAGGIEVFGARTTVIYKSTINNNTGGGVVIAGGLGGLLMEHSVVSGNVSSSSSLPYGGVYLNSGEGVIRHSTITANRSSSGGGIGCLAGTIRLNHSIVADNSAPSGPDISLGINGKAIASFSLIGDMTGSNLTEAPVGSPDGNGNVIGGPVHGAINPLLAPLADNGGLIFPGGVGFLTHALLPGSPAIDGGDAALTPGKGETPEFDLRGTPYSRIVGRRIDIGAIERQEVGTALGADFNFNGIVDGGDFLAWQRVFGAAPGSFSVGDATDDGVVDGDDLGVWQDRFGDDGTAPAVATTATISTGEFFSVKQSVAIRLDLADAALQSFSTLSRLDRPAIYLHLLNGLESSRYLWLASSTRNVERPSDQPDTVREETKSEGHRRGERKAGEPVSLEYLDRSFAEGTWLDPELSKWKNGYTWRDEEAGVLPSVTHRSLDPFEPRSKP